MLVVSQAIRGVRQREVRRALVALLVATPLALACESPTRRSGEVADLAKMLSVGTGAVVAEIGAGDGSAAVAFARLVGPDGRVYANELDPRQIARIRSRAGGAVAANVVLVVGSEASANLPDACCDAIFMRGVYHHFANPDAMLASIRKALRPGGRLAVIDFPPTWWLAPWTPRGVPANRHGHGIPVSVLKTELAGAGFVPLATVDAWRQRSFCVVVRKP